MYLLVHHADGGHWDHPKGHPEEGEHPGETAEREIAEETGFRVEIMKKYYKEASRPLREGWTKIVGYFIACPIGYEDRGISLQNGEILAVQWLPYKAARQKITWNMGKNILDWAESCLSKNSNPVE